MKRIDIIKAVAEMDALIISNIGMAVFYSFLKLRNFIIGGLGRNSISQTGNFCPQHF